MRERETVDTLDKWPHISCIYLLSFDCIESFRDRYNMTITKSKALYMHCTTVFFSFVRWCFFFLCTHKNNSRIQNQFFFGFWVILISLWILCYLFKAGNMQTTENTIKNENPELSKPTWKSLTSTHTPRQRKTLSIKITLHWFHFGEQSTAIK